MGRYAYGELEIKNYVKMIGWKKKELFPCTYYNIRIDRRIIVCTWLI